jgi:hypothetical protein
MEGGEPNDSMAGGEGDRSMVVGSGTTMHWMKPPGLEGMKPYTNDPGEAP